MNILFLCRGNVFRSQLAEYFFKELTKKHNVQSAGIDFKKKYDMPLKELYQKYSQTRKIVERYSLKLTNQRPKKITKEMIEKADKIIAILENEKCIPKYLKNNKKLIFWKVEDGIDENKKIKPLQNHYKIVKAIRKLVKDFIKNIS